jgi:hypothetical protein
MNGILSDQEERKQQPTEREKLRRNSRSFKTLKKKQQPEPPTMPTTFPFRLHRIVSSLYI